MAQVAEDLRFLLQRSKVYSAYLSEGDPLREAMEPILEWHISTLTLLQHPDRLAEIEVKLSALRDQPGMNVAVDAIEGEITAICEIFKRIWEKMPWHVAEDNGEAAAADKLSSEEGQAAALWQVGVFQTLLKSLSDILKESASPLLRSIFGLVDEGLEHIRSRRRS